jgi:hypothetical protein
MVMSSEKTGSQRVASAASFDLKAYLAERQPMVESFLDLSLPQQYPETIYGCWPGENGCGPSSASPPVSYWAAPSPTPCPRPAP